MITTGDSLKSLKYPHSEPNFHRDAQRARSYLIAVKIRPAQRDLNNTKVRETERRGEAVCLLRRQQRAHTSYHDKTWRTDGQPDHSRHRTSGRLICVDTCPGSAPRVVRSPGVWPLCCKNVCSPSLFCKLSWLTFFLLSHINYVGPRCRESIGSDRK